MLSSQPEDIPILLKESGSDPYMKILTIRQTILLCNAQLEFPEFLLPPFVFVCLYPRSVYSLVHLCCGIQYLL